MSSPLANRITQSASISQRSQRKLLKAVQECGPMITSKDFLKRKQRSRMGDRISDISILNGALKAVEITDDTVLFMDLEQIDLNTLTRCNLPHGCRIVGVNGMPNVEAMTRKELKRLAESK